MELPSRRKAARRELEARWVGGGVEGAFTIASSLYSLPHTQIGNDINYKTPDPGKQMPCSKSKTCTPS